MKWFRIYWLDGTTNEVQGETIAKTFQTRWHAGAIAAVDFFEEIHGPKDPLNYKWDDQDHTWIKKEEENEMV